MINFEEAREDQLTRKDRIQKELSSLKKRWRMDGNTVAIITLGKAIFLITKIKQTFKIKIPQIKLITSGHTSSKFHPTYFLCLLSSCVYTFHCWLFGVLYLSTCQSMLYSKISMTEYKQTLQSKNLKFCEK